MEECLDVRHVAIALPLQAAPSLRDLRGGRGHQDVQISPLAIPQVPAEQVHAVRAAASSGVNAGGELLDGKRSLAALSCVHAVQIQRFNLHGRHDAPPDVLRDLSDNPHDPWHVPAEDLMVGHDFEHVHHGVEPGPVLTEHLAARAIEVVPGVIEREVFSPEYLAYLTRRVNDALSRLGTENTLGRRVLETELRDAEKELENIKIAIRRGIITDTTKAMLEDAERKVQTTRAKMTVAAQPEMAASVRALPFLIDTYLKDLRSVLYRDTDRARLMLSKLVGEIILRPEEDGLVAEIRGNAGALLDVESGSPNGAGSGIPHLPTWHLAMRAVA